MLFGFSLFVFLTREIAGAEIYPMKEGMSFPPAGNWVDPAALFLEQEDDYEGATALPNPMRTSSVEPL